jgi:hypothetical protein
MKRLSAAGVALLALAGTGAAADRYLPPIIERRQRLTRCRSSRGPGFISD